MRQDLPQAIPGMPNHRLHPLEPTLLSMESP